MLEIRRRGGRKVAAVLVNRRLEKTEREINVNTYNDNQNILELRRGGRKVAAVACTCCRERLDLEDGRGVTVIIVKDH